ncbi:hypothetical protein Ciccas_008816 [Cichlidogyrus casuarinus]|uniref:Amine oxidase domain-containing protein n=1 Tax=Cichlidogyrus casuarinus TaxID=1844966 RepID=A0ABD2PZ98_9PLAT
MDVLLDLLYRMYPEKTLLRAGGVPKPESYMVTHWNSDPFALSSYTSGEPHSSDLDRDAYAQTLYDGDEPETREPRLLFAGEGTMNSSQAKECTHGALLTGLERAFEILIHHHTSLKAEPRYSHRDIIPELVSEGEAVTIEAEEKAAVTVAWTAVGQYGAHDGGGYITADCADVDFARGKHGFGSILRAEFSDETGLSLGQLLGWIFAPIGCAREADGAATAQSEPVRPCSLRKHPLSRLIRAHAKRRHMRSAQPVGFQKCARLDRAVKN